MPTYEYQCQTCEEVFDVSQSIKAAALKKAECPKCGTQRAVKRLIGSGGAVLFKGSGFYQTDYRSEGYNKAAKSEKEGGSSKDKKTESKGSDAKQSDSAGSSKTEATGPSKPAVQTKDKAGD